MRTISELRTITESEASRDLARVMEAAQLEPIAIQSQQLGAVLISTAEYNELIRRLKVDEFLRFCDRMGEEAMAAGMTEEVLQELLASDD